MIFYTFHEIDVKTFLNFFINNFSINITTIYIYIDISKGTTTNMKLVPSISIILRDDSCLGSLYDRDKHHVLIC